MKRKWNRRINFKPTTLTFYLILGGLTILSFIWILKLLFLECSFDLKITEDLIIFIMFLILSFIVGFLLSLLLTLPLYYWCKYERRKK